MKTKDQIHILREWDEIIQTLPDEAAGIVYKGIYNLVLTGEDTVTDDLDKAYKEAAARADDSKTMKDRAEAVGVMTQIIYAKTLWTTSILPHYLKQAN